MNTVTKTKQTTKGGWFMMDIAKQGAQGGFKAYNALNTKEIINEAFEAAAAGNEDAAAFIARLASSAKERELVDTFQKQAKLASVNWQGAKKDFITYDSKGGKRGASTKRLYTKAFETYEAFCAAKDIKPQEITRGGVKEYVRELVARKLSSATVKVYTAALRAFFSYIADSLDDDTDKQIENPFTRVKTPSKQSVRTCVYPSQSDVAQIISYLKVHEETGKLAKIAALMANDGFRIGAFESMDISDKGTARGVSKGKAYEKKLSKESIEALDGLRGKAFSEWQSAKAQSLFNYHISKMYDAGLISTRFSCHDFRHHYAVKLYKETKDIIAVQIALNHSSVTITETYLKELHLIK